MSNDVILKIEGLEKTYNNRKVLYNISFPVLRGHIYALIGENGAGKTTIMRAITGLISYKGKIELKNINGIGALIEEPALYYGLTAKENMQAVSLMKNVSIEEDIICLANEMGILENKSKVGNFSLGMKQKMGILLALIGKPKLLILDEPLNGLDPKATIQIRELLLKLSKQGTAILISSHMLDELFRVATDYLFISKGRLKQSLSYDEIINKYPETSVEEIYMDILEGNHVK